MKKYNYIHFVTDEKFIRDEIRCYEEAGLTSNNYFYVGAKDKHFDFIDSNIVKIISRNDVLKLFDDNSVDAVCLHNLYCLSYDLIAEIPKRIAVIWYAWGFDLYSNPAPLNPLLSVGERFMEDTKNFSNRNSIKVYCKRIAKAIIKAFHPVKVNLSLAKAAIERVDYFAGVFPMEYDMMKASVPYFRARKLTHNYIHPQEFRIEDINEKPHINGNNILLGNSAALLGNHIDIMKQIAPYVGNDVKIICPLSYAGTPKYVQEVIRQGKSIFGDRFVPLTTYLSLDEYTKTMRSCNRFVMGMIQQAATCNCLTSLWDGIKIYAPKRSMNYQQYNKMGIKLYSIEDDFGRETDEMYKNLRINRQIIEENYSFRSWVRDLKESITKINHKSNE